jgi:hypothetical protein
MILIFASRALDNSCAPPMIVCGYGVFFRTRGTTS